MTLSPLPIPSFLLVADLLQQLILKAFTPHTLCHPIDHSLLHDVLQYADDTLIIARANTTAATTLRGIFNDFADATGLAINFHKTTFLHIYTPPSTANDISAIFDCPTSCFPQIDQRNDRLFFLLNVLISARQCS